MLSTLAVFGVFCCVAVFIAPAQTACLSKEYETTDRQCCPMCHEGTIVRRDCTPQLGTRCIACVNGTFMNRPNGLTKCFSCTPCDQGLGLFAQQGCTVTKDSVCDVISGYFCKTLMDETGCSLAQKHKPCGPGYRIKSSGTSRTDTMCESCPPGYFSLEGVNCTVWTICSETQVKVKEGSTSSDVVCGAASSHRYGLIAGLILFTLTLVSLGITGIIVEKKHQSPHLTEELGQALQDPTSIG
ncbi:tumor necrosis factor receptor superfamily member 14-like isoform X2 [Cebidichthys violaceus]|uniref:tumor necrosis factor receptor superfamily member 14-like isoform X2 n=1 Tax=Cebidichthys violaceus TaxID=271503 RepID=UPI0035C98B0D